MRNTSQLRPEKLRIVFAEFYGNNHQMMFQSWLYYLSQIATTLHRLTLHIPGESGLVASIPRTCFYPSYLEVLLRPIALHFVDVLVINTSDFYGIRIKQNVEQLKSNGLTYLISRLSHIPHYIIRSFQPFYYISLVAYIGLLSRLYPRKRFFLSIHHPDRITKYLKLLRRPNVWGFVFAEYLCNHIPALHSEIKPDDLKHLSWITPVVMPTATPKTQMSEIPTLIVPGPLLSHKRNYQSIMDSVEHIARTHPELKFQIHLLEGQQTDESIAFTQSISNKGLSGYFIQSSGRFIPEDEYNAEVCSSHGLLPLIDPSLGDRYFKYGAFSAINYILGYQCIPIIHEELLSTFPGLAQGAYTHGNSVESMSNAIITALTDTQENRIAKKKALKDYQEALITESIENIKHAINN